MISYVNNLLIFITIIILTSVLPAKALKIDDAKLLNKHIKNIKRHHLYIKNLKIYVSKLIINKELIADC